MNILVIGSNGQLGSDCVSVLEKAGRVQGMDFPEIDIADASCVAEVLGRLRPEVVVNCAAYTAVDTCESDPACWKVNADGPKHLAKWAAENSGFLVHVSTDYVFDGKKPLFAAYTEADTPDPLSEYGKSKLAGEQAILDSGADAAILRTAWLYGVRGKNFLKTMLRLMLQNPDKDFKVVNDQYGSPTWSNTLARQIRSVMGNRAVGTFHASSEGYCSWFDLACTFLEELGVEHRFVPCSTDEFPTPAPRPANSILENAHAKKLGINVFTDWKDELRLFVEQNGATILGEINSL